MARLVETTLETLRGNDHEAIDDAVLVALAFYEKSAGGRLGEPICSEVLGEEASEHDIVNLREALVHLARSHPAEEFASSAIFALAKWEDPTLKSLFVEFMKASCENDRPHAMFNAMIALDRLGEDILPKDEYGHRYGSCNESERNRELVRKYLQKESKCQ